MLRTQRSDLVGISGWLFWFCLGTAIVAPLACVNAFSHAHDDFRWTLVGLALLYCFTGISVWFRRPEALTMVKLLLYSLLGLSGYHLIRIILEANGADPTPQAEAFGAEMMTRFCWALGWFLYFKYSKRVLATFGENI